MRRTSLALDKLGALLYLFATHTREVSLVCRKPSQHGIDHVKIPRIPLKSGFEGRPPCDDQMDQMMYTRPFNVASTSLGNKQGSKEANKTIRVVWITAA